MRLAVVCMLAFCACPTASLPKLDAGTVEPDRDAGAPLDCPEFFIEPAELDFGCVLRGETLTISQPDFLGGTPEPFSSPEFVVDDAGIHFTPTASREFSASALLFLGRCVIGRQRVVGVGVGSVVSWNPAAIDFGYVVPGETRTASVTLTNCAIEPVTVRQLSTSSPVFSVDAGSVTIPPSRREPTGELINGERRLELVFAPQSFGPAQSTLSGETAIATQPMIAVPLIGVGGGPIIEVNPLMLDFGAITMVTTRSVTIRNVGTQPRPPDSRVNLHLGGVDGGPPFYALDPPDCGTLMLGGAYAPGQGLDTVTSVPLAVTLQPTGMPRTCTLHIFSNATNDTDVEVAITAQ
ncbi:MAG: hypothetical protein JNM17_19645 [Archangium sp.]|nr:hypothetical protein [Archangium sp.]